MSTSKRTAFWRKRGESSTFKRLMNSQHVADLQLIFFVTLGSVLFVGALAVCFKLHSMNGTRHEIYTWSDTANFIATIAAAGVIVMAWAYQARRKRIFFVILWSVLFAAAFVLMLKLGFTDKDGSTYTWGDTGKFVGAIAAAGATVMAWAYQAGSKRLGVVDLFACEIVTLCRVGTVVQFIPNMITRYKSIGSTPKKATVSENPSQVLRFSSEENYFPVFETNSKDLQILEADVVNNVTAFYTYMKATRDMLRQLADLRLGGGPDDEQRKAVINVIFMVFLGYESARKAIDYLIEFEPTHAEDKIVLLFTELPAYRFLRGVYAPNGDFPDKIRTQRLLLRLEEYYDFIPELCQAVRKHAGEDDWKKANSMVAGLHEVFGDIKTEELRLAISPDPADQPPSAANAA